MNTKEMLMHILNTQKTRFFQFQKVFFLRELKAQLDLLGLDSTTTTDIYKHHKLHGLIIGNVKTATKILVTHYDTPSFLMDLFKTEPFNSKQKRTYSFVVEMVKMMSVFLVSGPLLVSRVQALLQGDNMYLNVFLVLLISLISILLIRMPGVIPSQKDKNAASIQFVINQMIERTEKIAVILVDDGSGNQLGFELLGQSLSATKSTAKIHAYEASSDASQFAFYQPKDIEDSWVKYFQDLSIHTYTN